MICPACAETAKLKHRRDVDEHFTVYRYYQCKHCLTEFNAVEKINFSSVPSHIRERFLSEGKRK